jgi:adenylosuccinate synthase
MILLEGAQGALLDLDTGTYPFDAERPRVGRGGWRDRHGLGPPRSSGSSASQVVPDTAWATARCRQRCSARRRTRSARAAAASRHGRVQRDHRRARRIGWFDGVLARYTARLNGVTSVALTRLDTLSHAERIKICVAYEVDGQRVMALPPTLSAMERPTRVRDAAGRRT